MNEKEKKDELQMSVNYREHLLSNKNTSNRFSNFSILQQFDISISRKQRQQWRINCMFLFTQCIIDLSFGLDQLRQSSLNENTLSLKIIYNLIAFSSAQFVLILLLFYITNFIDSKTQYWKQYMTVISFFLLFAQVEIMILQPDMFMVKFLTIYLILQSLCVRQIIGESKTYKFCLFAFLVYVIVRHQILLKFQLIILIYNIFTCGVIIFFSFKGDINQEVFLLAQSILMNVPDLRTKPVFTFDQHAYTIMPQNISLFQNSSQISQPKFYNSYRQSQQQQQQKQQQQNQSQQQKKQQHQYLQEQQQQQQQQKQIINNQICQSNLNHIPMPQDTIFTEQIDHQQDPTKSTDQYNKNVQSQKQNQEIIFRNPIENSQINSKMSSACNKQVDASHFSPSIQYQSQSTQHLNQIYVDILSLIPQGIALINNQRDVIIANNSILSHFKCNSQEQLLSKIFAITKSNLTQKTETPSNQSINSPVSIKRGNIASENNNINNNYSNNNTNTNNNNNFNTTNNIRSNRNSSLSSAIRDSIISKKSSILSDKLNIQRDKRASILSQFKLKEMQSQRLSISNNKREISELFDEILSQDLNSQYFDNKDDQESNIYQTKIKRRKSMNFKLGINKTPTSSEEPQKDHGFQFTVEKNIIQYTFHDGDKTFSLKIMCCEMQQQSQTNIQSPIARPRKGTLGSPINLNGSIPLNKTLSGVEPAILIITEDISNKILLQKLERLNKQKKRMVASISHELRTPLNCSIGLLDLLLQHPGMPNDLLQEYLMPALYSNRLLFNIVNDIIDFSQIDSGKFQLSFKIFDLRQLLDECVMLMKISISKKNLQLSLHVDSNIPNCINSDPQRIRQIILNILSNAVKYTYKGSIKIEATNIDSNYIQIKVIDTGIGIKEEHMNQIFEQFGRIQEEKVLETEGAGLGLTISMNLAKGVGGNRGIDVKSIFGKGSIFSFFILKQEFKKKGASMTKKEIFNKSMYQVISYTQGMNSVELKDLSIDHTNENNSLDISSTVSGINPTSQGSIMLDKKAKSQKEKQEEQPVKAIDEINNQLKSYLPIPDNQGCCSISQTSLYSQIANENQNDSDSHYTIHQPGIQQASLPCTVSTYQSPTVKTISIQSARKQIFSSAQPFNNPMIRDLSLKISARYSFTNNDQITETSKEYQENGASISESLKNIQKSSTLFSPTTILSGEELKIGKSKQQQTKLSDSPPRIFINSFGLPNLGSSDYKDKQNFSNEFKSIEHQLQDSIDDNEEQLDSATINKLNKKNVTQTKQMKRVDCYEEFKSMSKTTKNNNQLVNSVIEKIPNKLCKCNQILIAEDNEFNLFLLKKMLETFKLEVDSAMNGQQAIDMVTDRFNSPCLCKKNFKLIFMDIDMPIKNGYQATQEIIKFCKQNNQKPPLICACSAYVGDEDKKQALKEGMTYFITKPIEMKVIQSVLKKTHMIV